MNRWQLLNRAAKKTILCLAVVFLLVLPVSGCRTKAGLKRPVSLALLKPLPKSWQNVKSGHKGVWLFVENNTEKQKIIETIYIWVDLESKQAFVRKKAKLDGFYINEPTYPGIDPNYQGVVLAQNGRWLINSDGLIKDIRTGKSIRIIKASKGWHVHGLSWTETKNRLAVALTKTTYNEKSRAQVFAFNPLTGKILSRVMTVDSIDVWGLRKASDTVGPAGSFLREKQNWLAYSDGVRLNLMDSRSAKRHFFRTYDLSDTSYPYPTVAISPSGRSFLFDKNSYKNDGIYWQPHDMRTEPVKLISSAWSKRQGGWGSANFFVWTDDKHFVLAEYHETSDTAKKSVNISAYRFDNDKIALKRESAALLTDMTGYGNVDRISFDRTTDGKMIIVGQVLEGEGEFKQKKSALVVYDYKQNDFFKIDLGVHVDNYEILGRGRDWR